MAGVNDIALVSLARPVTGVQPVTVIRPGDPLPSVGTLVTMVGYGVAGTGTMPATVNDNRRRVGQSNVRSLSPNLWAQSPLFLSTCFSEIPPSLLQDHCRSSKLPPMGAIAGGLCLW